MSFSERTVISNKAGSQTAEPDSDGSLPVKLKGPLTAFGEMTVAELTPAVQLQFPYNINSSQAIVFPGNGGAVIDSNSQAELFTGTSADGFAFFISKDILKYNSGQGGLWRGTAVFTTGVASSTQIIGLGDTQNGYFFGYDGTAFGVLRRSGGMPESQTLTVTTGSSTAENITVTLDGDVIATVAVTASSDVTVTAREISAAVYASVGTGWGSQPHGAEVTFVSLDTATHTGTFSISGTTVVGSFAQEIASNAATDTWTVQANWNVDPMDGTGPSGMTLDQTKGNVLEICYQWLGYGMITFAIENSETGILQPVHRIKYANSSTFPSTAQPSMRLFMEVVNEGNTSDLSIKSSSMSAFVQGVEMNLGPLHGCQNLFTIGNVTTEEPVFTVRNKHIFQGKINEVRILPTTLTLTSNLTSANSNTVFRIYGQATAENGTSYADIDTSGSVVECDVSAVDFDISDASLLEVFILDKAQSLIINLGDARDRVDPATTLMITAQPSKGNVSNEVGASLNWRELI